MQSSFPRWLSVALLSGWLVSCSADAVAPGAATRDDNLAPGQPPAGAVADPSSYQNYLLVRPQYTLSYHRDRGTPNWGELAPE